MKKANVFSALAGALLLVLSLTGCKEDTVQTDESQYPGTYIGFHYLADSANLRVLLGTTGDSDFIYKDTLVVTTGTDSTDGKLNGRSALLNGKTIEITLANNNVTPVFLGNINILGNTLKNSSITSGNASWNSSKTTLNTQLQTKVTYDFNGTDIVLQPVPINGSFVKQ